MLRVLAYDFRFNGSCFPWSQGKFYQSAAGVGVSAGRVGYMLYLVPCSVREKSPGKCRRDEKGVTGFGGRRWVGDRGEDCVPMSPRVGVLCIASGIKVEWCAGRVEAVHVLLTTPWLLLP